MTAAYSFSRAHLAIVTKKCFRVCTRIRAHANRLCCRFTDLREHREEQNYDGRNTVATFSGKDDTAQKHTGQSVQWVPVHITCVSQILSTGTRQLTSCSISKAPHGCTVAIAFRVSLLQTRVLEFQKIQKGAQMTLWPKPAVSRFRKVCHKSRKIVRAMNNLSSEIHEAVNIFSQRCLKKTANKWILSVNPHTEKLAPHEQSQLHCHLRFQGWTGLNAQKLEAKT